MITKELKRGKKHQEELGILLVGQQNQNRCNLSYGGLFVLNKLKS